MRGSATLVTPPSVPPSSEFGNPGTENSVGGNGGVSKDVTEGLGSGGTGGAIPGGGHFGGRLLGAPTMSQEQLQDLMSRVNPSESFHIELRLEASKAIPGNASNQTVLSPASTPTQRSPTAPPFAAVLGTSAVSGSWARGAFAAARVGGQLGAVGGAVAGSILGAYEGGIRGGTWGFVAGGIAGGVGGYFGGFIAGASGGAVIGTIAGRILGDFVVGGFVGEMLDPSGHLGRGMNPVAPQFRNVPRPEIRPAASSDPFRGQKIQARKRVRLWLFAIRCARTSTPILGKAVGWLGSIWRAPCPPA